MTTPEIYICCVSWEDRFIQSLQHNIEIKDWQEIITYVVYEFKELINDHSGRCNSLLKPYKDKEVHSEIVVSSKDDIDTWKKLSSGLSLVKEGNKVVLDISTMPRYLIWASLHFLEKCGANVELSYCSPTSYSDGDVPLTREPLEPRLILKHSGIFLPERPTVLIVQAGFDYDRLIQLILTYEPEKVVLAVQEGNQFNNNARHQNESDKKIRFEKLGYSNFEEIPIDAFSDDHGFSVLECMINNLKDMKNIILASMGPKIMAGVMYKLNKKYPDVGLVDVPVGQYNREYSKGANLDEIISMQMNF